MNSDRNMKFEITWQSVTRGYTAAALPDGFGYVCNCYAEELGCLFTWTKLCDLKHTACWP